MISVAICTRNGERFVAEQVASVLAQTVSPGEIVLSDDASEDSTVQIVRSMVRQHNQLRPAQAVSLIELENDAPLGVAQNFQQALNHCTGDLIALCDQDDVWVKRKLERMTALFAAEPRVLLVHSDARLTDENGDPVGGSLFDALGVSSRTQQRIQDGAASALLMKRNVVTGATTVIRRDLWTQASPVPEGWIHDEWLAMVAATLGGLALIPEPLIDYRQHGRNAIGAARLSFAQKLRRLTEPGYTRNERLYLRAASLYSRLAVLPGVPSAVLVTAQQKLVHETVRQELDVRRWRRLGPIVRELWSGRYGRFGQGPVDAVRDLVQPLTPAR